MEILRCKVKCYALFLLKADMMNYTDAIRPCLKQKAFKTINMSFI